MFVNLCASDLFLCLAFSYQAVHYDFYFLQNVPPDLFDELKNIKDKRIMIYSEYYVINVKGNFASVMTTATREHTVMYFYNCPIAGPFFKLLRRKEKEEG